MASQRTSDHDGARDESQIMTGDLIQAVDHLSRRRLLRALHRLDEAQSPTQLAKIIGEKANNVTYHVKVLVRLGVVHKTGGRPVRGARENFFASKVSSHKQVLSILADTEREDRRVLT